MNRPTRYREVAIGGTPTEMGHQLGELAGDEVRGFCEIAMEHVRKTCAVSEDKAYDVARQSGDYAARYAPHMVEELHALAEAANVTFADLMLIQVRNQLQPDSDSGCTAVSIASQSVRRGAVVAQNWDADPDLDPFTIVLTRRPQAKPAALTCTQAGLISYLGFNSAGIGACVNTLPAPSREVGVPHYFTLRAIHESASLEQAYAAVDSAFRAIPANIVLSTPQGPADFEVTIDHVYQLTPQDCDWLTHSNHCLHMELQETNKQFPELIQSHARIQRIDELMAGSSRDVTAVMEMLRDHQGFPKSICRHTNDDPAHGFWTTVFSIVMEPEQRRMFVSRGNPCQQPYEEYVLVE